MSGLSKSEIKQILNDVLHGTNKKVICKLDELIEALTPREESLDPVLFCTIIDENCVLTGAQAIIRDEETGEFVTVYFDANFEPTTVPPEGTPCDTACGGDYGFEMLPPVCYEDADNNKWQLVVTLTYQNGVQISQGEIWISPSGQVFSSNPGGLSPCDVDCNPQIQEFDLSETVTSYIPFTNIVVCKPDCCMVTVETSAGTFRVRPEMKCFHSSTFECDVELLNITIEGDCDPSQVYAILENKGCSSCNV